MINVLENQKGYDLINTCSPIVIFEKVQKRLDSQNKLAEQREDIALSKAIEEGEQTPLVSRSEIFNLLENDH